MLLKIYLWLFIGDKWLVIRTPSSPMQSSPLRIAIYPWKCCQLERRLNDRVKFREKHENAFLIKIRRTKGVQNPVPVYFAYTALLQSFRKE